MKMDFKKNKGLIPAVVQDYRTGNVLMLGYMNEEAYEITDKDKKVTFFSRSKNRIWQKGESSGNYLELVKMEPDCDGDTLLVQVIPHGPVCHTGKDTCWGHENRSDYDFLSRLEEIIAERKENRPEGSYTSSLFSEGINRIAQKVGEEAVEVLIEAKDQNDERLIQEIADLLFHLLVLLRSRDLTMKDVIAVLKDRYKGSPG